MRMKERVGPEHQRDESRHKSSIFDRRLDLSCIPLTFPSRSKQGYCHHSDRSYPVGHTFARLSRLRAILSCWIYYIVQHDHRRVAVGTSNSSQLSADASACITLDPRHENPVIK